MAAKGKVCHLIAVKLQFYPFILKIYKKCHICIIYIKKNRSCKNTRN